MNTLRKDAKLVALALFGYLGTLCILALMALTTTFLLIKGWWLLGISFVPFWLFAAVLFGKRTIDKLVDIC